MNAAACYRLLGLHEGASEAAIKQAYRNLAKIWHPDRNKHPDAEKRFVELTEAYTLLLHPKLKVTPAAPSVDEIRKEARRKAAQAARMRYETFVQSDYYKTASSVSAFMDILLFLGLTGLLSWLLFITHQQGYYVSFSMLLSLGILVIVVFGIQGYRNKTYTVTRYLKELNYLIHIPSVQAILIMLLNVVVYVGIGFRTLIPLPVLLVSYVTVALLIWAVFRFLNKRKPVYAGMVSSGLLSILLLVNYVFARNPREMTCYFNSHPFSDQTLVRFEEDVFEEFPGVRFFWDYRELRGKSSCVYELQEGALGVMVVTRRTLK